MLDLPKPSSVHSFIHLKMLMQVPFEPGPGDAEMNKQKQPLHSQNVLPTGGNTHHYTLNSEKCSMEQPQN